MPVRGFHARLLVLLALFALCGQAAVVFESAWHSHEHERTQDTHQDGCAICAAVLQTGTPAPEPFAVAPHCLIALVRISGEVRPAHLYAAPAIAPRGPPTPVA